MEQLLDQIDSYADEQMNADLSMEMPMTGNYCLARYENNFNRAKIIENVCNYEEIYAKVFFCDMGLIANCHFEDIIEISDEIMNLLPFQAICCSLYGIEPLSDDGKWTKAQNNEIYAKISKANDCKVKVISVKNVSMVSGVDDLKEIQVILIDVNRQRTINDMAVDDGLAKYAENGRKKIMKWYDSAIDSSEWDDDEQFEESEKKKNEEEEPNQLKTIKKKGISSDESDTETDQEHGQKVDFFKTMNELINDPFNDPDIRKAMAGLMDVNYNSSDYEDSKIFVAKNSSFQADTKAIEPPTNSKAVKMIKKMSDISKPLPVVWRQSNEFIWLKTTVGEHVQYNLIVTEQQLVLRSVNISVFHFKTNRRT